MSTVPEAITAHHCSIKVLAFSLITNMCVTEKKYDRIHKNNNNNNNNDNNDGTKHVDLETEVLDTAKARKEDIKRFMIKIVEKIEAILTKSVSQKC